MVKYIFVVGGVMSGVGKGTTVASIAKILQSKGVPVTAVKIDPYLNVDAGTMNPTEHGEVFVTEDGDETDQDIGNYERFLDQNILSTNYMTTGRVYRAVIEKERALGYGGKCVEAVPHIPEEIIRRLNIAARKTKAKVVVVEIGGTVGEYQNLLFIEAGRMLKLKHPSDVVFILVSFLPVPAKIGEMKTKPTQTAAHLLNSAGVQPDFIIGRSNQPIDIPRKRKLATFCGVREEDVISAPDVTNIYEIPLNFERDGLGSKILKKLKIKSQTKDLKSWKRLTTKIKGFKKEVKIAIVGKYFKSGDFTFSDSYISLIEALKHAAWAQNLKPILSWIDSTEFEKSKTKLKELKNYDGILIPGGFGERGVEGKISAVHFARVNKIPYLGICYGMQMAVIEFARNVLKLKGANTKEINPKTPHPVIDLIPEQLRHLAKNHFGGTMRLGAYPCHLKDKSLAQKAYAKFKIKTPIKERHRHRYEFNNKYRIAFEKKGALFSGLSPKGALVEIFELADHPFFLGTQFHPEFKSRPLFPHPIYFSFIKAASKKRIVK
ncbi:CTP synthase [Candidatus Parcubacteria bacterium]|nr:MAG: CTP synthase [Candidatus Parcubacteria bacterium]